MSVTSIDKTFVSLLRPQKDFWFRLNQHDQHVLRRWRGIAVTERHESLGVHRYVGYPTKR
jgi:hypothetical protein